MNKYNFKIQKNDVNTEINNNLEKFETSYNDTYVLCTFLMSTSIKKTTLNF